MTHDDDEEVLAVARAGFLDEAREMLRQFEQSLLIMESDPQDTENLNAAFRAAHTIKGTAGLFGFDAVVAFTHEAETLLEHLRSGGLKVSDTITALLLQSRDQMEALLEEVSTGSTDPAIAERGQTLAAQLRQQHGNAIEPSPTADHAPEATPSSASSGYWHFSVRMGADALRHGLDPLSFLRYLATLGEVHAVRTLVNAIPPLDLLDAESCHLGFELRLASAADRATLEGVFEFCADDSDVALLAPGATPAEYEALLERRCQSDPQRAELLRVWQDIGCGLPARPAPEAVDNSAPTHIERRAGAGADRRQSEPERRQGAKDRRSSDDARFIRVRADKLDRLIDLVGELVIASSGAQLVAEDEHSPRFAEAALRIHDLVQEARDGALGLRMVPIGETFARFNRVVRDVCKQLGKEVELQVTGGDTELDKSMVDTVADPLMHLVRNSLDHGIETAEDRQATGKPAVGRLALHAYHESGSVVIEVTDDGKGLDRARILAKACERGLVAEGADLSDDEIYQLIFTPGFSTAAAVTNLSGRGVGMDVVKRNIDALRGQIKIASQPGQGTTMQIRLPLTLAIIDGFLVAVGGVAYVVPLEIVAECIEVPSSAKFSKGHGSGCFDLRGEVVPFLDLRQCFGQPENRPSRQSLIVVNTESSRLGLLVDKLLGEHQTVIKPLGPIFQHLQGVAGSTILGSGEVALILDVAALERRAQRAEASGQLSAAEAHKRPIQTP